jgi:hypothetical protein
MWRLLVESVIDSLQPEMILLMCIGANIAKIRICSVAISPSWPIYIERQEDNPYPKMWMNVKNKSIESNDREADEDLQQSLRSLEKAAA